MTRGRMRGESGIVWLEDVSKQPYVREDIAELGSKSGPPPKRRIYPGRVVGYTTLDRSVKSDYRPLRYFTRRVFWLRSGDPYSLVYMPADGVRPSEIEEQIKGSVEEEY